MRKETLLLFMIYSLALTSMAQQSPISHCTANNINATILGNGSLFLPKQEETCPVWEVPAGSGKETIYQHSLWFGGLDSDDSLHLAAFTFGLIGQDYWSGPLKTTDASIDFMTALKFHHIWSLTRTEVDYFIEHHGETSYEVPDDILTWPAHGEGDYAANLAPFIDVDGDGHYNPEAGDYPDIKGDQCLFFIFNESFADHTESGGKKIGLEVHAMVYAYNAPDDEALNNTVFINYKFFNRSHNNYHDVHLGLWTDWDIGDGWDDYVGCDVQRGSCFAYNGLPEDGSGEPNAYGDNPPVQVLTVLAGPYLDADGRDNPTYTGNCEALFNEAYPTDKYAYNGYNFGNGIEDDERIGMTGFMYHTNTQGNNGDPITAENYYNYLRCLWKNGQPMQYGGNAYDTGTLDLPSKFMFPNDTDPCNWGTNGVQPTGYGTNGVYWTEEQSGNTPDDRRGLAMVGPFNLPMDGIQELDYAIITVWKNSNQTAMERKGEFIDHIKTLFSNGLE